jgi:hypothetical protein
MSNDSHFTYWLTTSAVQFTGTKTTTTYPHSPDAKDVKYDAQATLILRADRAVGPVSLDVKHSWFAESKLSLSMTEDGRLSGAERASTGEGTQILGAVASLTGVLATLAPVIFAAAVPSLEPFPQQDDLKALRDNANKLASKLAIVVGSITAGDNASIEAAGPVLTVIDKAVSLVDGQIDRLTKQQLAWVAGVDSVETFTLTLDASELPTKQQLEGGLKDANLDLARFVWSSLGIMATVEDAGKVADSNEADPFQPGAELAVWYRRPRPARLSIRKMDPSTQVVSPDPVSVSDVALLDKKCVHLPIELGKDGLFRTSDYAVTFGANGTPATINSDRDSGLASAAQALAKVPSQVGTGISDITSISAAWSAAHPSAADRELSELEAKDKRLQLLADIAKLQTQAQTQANEG